MAAGKSQSRQSGSREICGLDILFHDAHDVVKGLTGTKNLFNKDILQRVKDGRIVKIGTEGNFDTKIVLHAVQGLLPIGFYLWWMQERLAWSMLLFLPCLTMYFLYLFIWRRLRGYTGDCCGALFLLTELTGYLVISYYLAYNL